MKSVCLVVCLLVFVVSNQLFAQSKSSTVTIKALEMWSNRTSDGENGFEYRLNTFYNGTRNSNCVDFNNQPVNTWLGISVGDQLRISGRFVSDINTALPFETEGWEEDECKEDCEYNTNNSCFGADESHCSQSLPENIGMNPYNMVPGNYTSSPNLQTYSFCGGSYLVKYLVTYNPPTPKAPTVRVDGTELSTSSSGNRCDDPSIELTTSIYINPAYLNHVQYKWEYHIYGETTTYYIPNPEYCGNSPMCSGDGGPVQNSVPNMPQALKGAVALAVSIEGGDPPPCCYLPSQIEQTDDLWREVPGGMTYGHLSDGSKSFSLRSLPGLTAITENSRVEFRVTAYANGLNSTFSSPGVIVNMSPTSPSATIGDRQASCPNSPSGVVFVTGVSSIFSTYRYILVPGNQLTLACNPDVDGSCLNGKISGQASRSGFSIPNVPKDEHTLFLLNNAGTEGFCPRRIGTTIVPVIPQLVVNQNPVVPANISCYDINNASITVSISEGNPANVLYTLKNKTTAVSVTRTSTTANASVSIPDLSPGEYELTVDDHCTNPVTRNFIITQPVKVTQKDPQFENVAATCSDPGNGTVKIYTERSAGAFDVSTSATTLVYEIFKDNISLDKVESSSLNYTWNNLSPGTNYEIRVKEKDGANCNAAIKTFSIGAPTIIGMSNLVITPVSCFGGNNGEISVGGTGRTTYLYQITGKDGIAINNATGDFAALNAGGYKLVIKNRAGCNDNYTRTDSIQVSQPQLLLAHISKEDISCYGLKNGTVTSTVTGGSLGTAYTYIWEIYFDGSNPGWVEIANQIDATLSERGDGKYRLRVKDDNQCDALSNEVTIIEPAQLVMSSATVTDIACLGEKGKIIPIVTGGTAPYSLYYSINNWTTSTLFTTSTLLDANVYQVKVKDKNGCEFIYPDNREITASPSVVSFTEQLSDFNGFNISCYGGSNGSAVIIAIGGNGSSYSGYTYTVDSRPYQTNPTLENISAGSHMLHVKDGRGCVASKTIPFTQTTAVLAAQVIEKQDLVCFDGATGSIEIKGTGGNAPFQYSMDGGTFADAGRFTQLKKGIYNITVKDRNNCTSASPYELISLHPELIIQTSITDVSCFDGKDGALATTVVGGASPYQYQWKEVSSTSANITALGVGTYILTVTDQLSCTMKTTATVQQPLQPLKIRLATVPVCYDRPNGSITATVNGGTAPYQYSIDNGLTYQREIAFSKGAGNYVITSRDSKGCIITSSTTIDVRNTMPEPNFLVASARNALDTLAIIDISVPKPDSIHWTFDPQAIIIKDDPWTPELRFTEPGTYQVKMTGFFAGCDYSVTKKMTLSPYDPSVVKESLPGYKPIESMTVTPNPSNGEFEVNIKLTKKYKLSIVIFDVLGVRHYNKNWTDLEELSEKIVLTDVPAGVYMLRAITESDAKDVRIVINK